MTCHAEPARVWPDKHPDATLDYGVSFEPECARAWAKWTDFSTGTSIRVFLPGHESGLEFEATTGGRTAGRRPQFPFTAGDWVDDGSVVWTARALSAASLRRTIVGTPTWVATGVTISDESIAGLIATANMGGGDNRQDYPVSVTAELSDSNIIVKVCILPVRIPVRVCA